MEGFPSGQREQTVNLSSMTSVVRIHHLPPKQKDIPKGMSFFCFGGRWLWIRKVALRNSPVGCFNHRGFRRNGSESTTGRVGTRVAVRLWDCTSQSRQARARSEGKNRLFDSEINLYRLFGTIYCRLRRYPVGAHSVAQAAQNHTVRGRTLRLAKSRLRRLLAGRPLRWVCSPLRFRRCR